MESLRIYVDLLKDRAAWVGAALFFLVNIPLFQFIDRPAAELGYFESNAIIRTLGIVVFGFFIFPVTRTLAKGRIELAAPQVWTWVGTAILLGLANFGLGFSITVTGYYLWPEAGLILGPEWHQYFLEGLILSAFLGFHTWQTGLICGRSSPSLAAVVRFVWGRRSAFFVLYLALSMVDFAIMLMITPDDANQTPLWFEAVIAARYAFFTWCLSLIPVAIYLEIAGQSRPITEVFE